MKTNFMITRLIFLLMAMALIQAGSVAQHPILGTTDISAFLEEVPSVPFTLDEAARRAYGTNLLQPDRQALDRFYQPVEDKVNRRILDYQDYYQKKMQEPMSVYPWKI